ncbi:MAG: hypothetical protein AAF799_36730 [Myxococcota bacterium]
MAEVDPPRDGDPASLSHIARWFAFAVALLTAGSWMSCGLIPRSENGPSVFTGITVFAVVAWLTTSVLIIVASRRLDGGPESSGVHRLSDASRMLRVSGVTLLILVVPWLACLASTR